MLPATSGRTFLGASGDGPSSHPMTFEEVVIFQMNAGA